jgi:ABC-type phosphate transport system substrate-binding protein
MMNTNKKNGAKRSAVTAGVVAAMIAVAPMAVTAAPTSTTAASTGATIYELHGSGTTNPSKLIWWAMDKLEERATTPVRMTYRSIGSGSGEKDWANNEKEGGFASTDYGLDPASTVQPVSGAGNYFTNHPNGFLQVPFQLGAVSFFHNIPGIKTGELKLSPCTVAKIWTNQITSWDHADIAADAGMTLPAERIKFVYRSNGSSSTYGVKGYMRAACPEVYGASGDVSASPITQVQSQHSSNPDHYFPVTGSDSMRKAIADNEYSIGYLDAGHGHADDLPEVALKNANDQWVVTKEGFEGDIVSADIEAVITDSLLTTLTNKLNTGATADWSGDDVRLYHKEGDLVWPICAFTFIHLRKEDTMRTGLAIALTKFILSTEGQSMVSNFLFFPLPETLRGNAANALTNFAANALVTNSNKWLFETDYGKTDVSSVTLDPQDTLGYGKQVFSSKRSNYADYERELMMGDIEAIIATIKRVHPGIEISTDPDADNGSMLTLKDKAAIALGACAFVMSFVAALFGFIALQRSSRSARIMPVAFK